MTNELMKFLFFSSQFTDLCIRCVLVQVLLLMRNLTVNLSSPDFDPVVSFNINLIYDSLVLQHIYPKSYFFLF